MNRFLEIAASLVDLPPHDDRFAWRILSEYGAVFVTTAEPPPCIIFGSAAAVEAFQANANRAKGCLESVEFHLQQPALDALLQAATRAHERGLRITPRGGDAGARSWGDSESLWRGRVERACTHWAELGRIGDDDIGELSSLDAREQARRILDLENEGIYFSTYFDKSILHSVAAPGTSQHLSMLAFDVAEFTDPAIRSLLNLCGWHQTVVSDLPHFTFLGREEGELPSLGLKRITMVADEQEYVFWVPAL